MSVSRLPTIMEGIFYGHWTAVASGHWYTDPAWLTVVGVLATACFAAVALVLTYMGYLHVRDASGRRKPITTDRVVDDQFFFQARAVLGNPYVQAGTEGHSRLGYVHFFNQSDSEQVVGFLPRQARIVWPRKQGCRLEAIPQSFALPAHKGGAIPLVFVSSTKEWPQDQTVDNAYKRWYFVKLKGKTSGQRPVKYRGRLLLTSYDPMRLPRLGIAKER